MTIADIRDIALSLPYVTEDIKWVNHLCFSVGGKMFMITSPDEVPVNASFKVTGDDLALFIDKDGFKAAPYLARYNWILVENINLISKNEWKRLIESAYQIVYDRLPVKVKKGLVVAGS